jgi:FemAB-related protein (PEP-CTERM system-associated)
MTIHEATDREKEAWDAYALSHPSGSAYHLYAWKQAVERAYGFPCPYFLAENKGKVCGFLPTVQIHWPLRSGALVSLPYCDVAGPLADSPSIEQELISYAFDYAKHHGMSRLELRGQAGAKAGHDDRPSQSDLFHQTPAAPKVRMLLDLPASSEALMTSFKSKLRSQVKKTFRDGLSARLGGIELLEGFYAVFRENMRDLGSPVHSKGWIESILKQFGSRAVCGLVDMPDGSPAACGIILCHDQTVSIPWASSLRRFNRYSPNMLLYWSFLEYAARHGYSWFDFGRSTPDEGTYKFKQQWGAKPRPLRWVRYDTAAGNAPDEVQGSDGTDRMRSLAEGMIKTMPVPMATFLGSRLRKYISL